jgi:hypothetical protein
MDSGVMDAECAWRGPHLAEQADWQYRLTAGEVDEVDSALRHFGSLRIAFLEATLEDFPLPRLGVTLRRLIERLERSRGFVIVRGLPVAAKSAAEARAMLWGLGLHMGIAIPQNAEAEMIVSVKDESLMQPSARSYASSEGIEFHVDPCDLVALLCRQPAMEGGQSLIASSLAVHDEIQRRRPDLLEVLYEPFPFVERTSAADRPYYESPIFGVVDGWFTSHYFKRRTLAAEQCPGAPSLTPQQREAVDLVEQVASDPQIVFRTMLEGGDLQIMSNHLVYHSRTAFRDFDAPEARRHLYRLWLSTPLSRPLPQRFAAAWNGPVAAGALRGGYRGWEFRHLVGDYQKRAAQALQLAHRGGRT